MLHETAWWVIMAISHTQNSHEIRTVALLRAVRFCGSMKSLGNKIKTERSVINKWINYPTRKIPYNKAILIEKITGITVENLLPEEQEANEYFRKGAADKLVLRYILINNILINDLTHPNYKKSNNQIIIGTDCVLISGLTELNKYKAAKLNQVPALIIDLEGLFLGKILLKDISNNLLISERIAIGLRLEQLVGNRQGQRNDLVFKNKANNSLQLSGICCEVNGRSDDKIANIIDFSTRSYNRAKKVYLHSLPEVIAELDQKNISIFGAFYNSKLAKNQII